MPRWSFVSQSGRLAAKWLGTDRVHAARVFVQRAQEMCNQIGSTHKNCAIGSLIKKQGPKFHARVGCWPRCLIVTVGTVSARRILFAPKRIPKKREILIVFSICRIQLVMSSWPNRRLGEDLRRKGRIVER